MEATMIRNQGMKCFILLLSLFSFSGVFAAPKSNRWILVNPVKSGKQLKDLGYKHIKSFQISRSSYTVIEAANHVTAKTLKKNAQAQIVQPDFPIKITRPISKRKATAEEEAWHVKRMQYANIPNNVKQKPVIVAVLDTGLDVVHPALKDHLWVNKKEIPGNGIDDDGNGFIDDVNGYSFADKSANLTDIYQHGTHCAGIIASSPRSADRYSAQGVAQNVKLMGVKIIQGKGEDFLSDAAAGIKYAVDNGAQVLSNSWRVYKTWDHYYPNEKNLTILKDAIAYAEKKGAIFVAAAGNETIDNDNLKNNGIFPVGFTGLSNLVGVAASDQDDHPADFTNYGTKTVHVGAPGVDIISTVPGKKWMEMSGTSMATPLVAGVLALGLNTYKTWQEAVDALIKTSEPLAQWENKVTSKGIVNIVDYLKSNLVDDNDDDWNSR